MHGKTTATEIKKICTDYDYIEQNVIWEIALRKNNYSDNIKPHFIYVKDECVEAIFKQESKEGCIYQKVTYEEISEEINKIFEDIA